ncbi:MAG: DUF615 domain-containing protein [Proteobacteria bacterium]|nr:DUF615 domain-containing protein [Pseudomonadota bacterium]
MDNHLDEKSRTKIKKEAHDLQKLGERLISLSHDQLGAIDIPPELREAVRTIRSINSNQAKRRQLQYIGALMRTIDTQPIHQALSYIEAGISLKKNKDTQEKEWAKALVDGDDSVHDTLLSRFPGTDRQKLQQLTRNARKLKEGPNALKSFKLLVKYIKELSIS